MTKSFRKKDDSRASELEALEKELKFLRRRVASIRLTLISRQRLDSVHRSKMHP